MVIKNETSILKNHHWFIYLPAGLSDLFDEGPVFKHVLQTLLSSSETEVAFIISSRATSYESYNDKGNWPLYEWINWNFVKSSLL